MLIFYISEDSVQNNKVFVACYHLETKLKLQLTTDMKSDSSKKKKIFEIFVSSP